VKRVLVVWRRSEQRVRIVRGSRAVAARTDIHVGCVDFVAHGAILRAAGWACAA